MRRRVEKLENKLYKSQKQAPFLYGSSVISCSQNRKDTCTPSGLFSGSRAKNVIMVAKLYQK